MNKKIIAVDARPLSSRISGISRTISKVIENIQEDFEFHLFSHLPYHNDFENLLKQKNVIWNHSSNLLSKKGGLWYLFELPKILKKLKPDIFWGTQQMLPPSIPANIKKVITIHDFVIYYYPQYMRKFYYIQQKLLTKYSIKHTDLIICNSKQSSNDLKKIFPGVDKNIEVIPWGIDLTVNKKNPINLPVLSQNYILAVSTIEPRKNYSTLIEAYYKYYLSESKDPYYLVIVGRRGWESKEFYHRLEELQEKTNHIIILDGVQDELLFSLYKNAAFFCMPSIYEGFGIPVLEALSFQKNIIVSDIPCFHEIAESYAKFLPPLDVELWAKSITEYVSLHREKKLPRVNFPIDQWTWKVVGKNYKEAFSSLISS